jgi:hypothetical protein
MLEGHDNNLDEVRKLYPHMTDEELRIARNNLRRYVEILRQIQQRLKAEGKDWPGLEK